MELSENTNLLRKFRKTAWRFQQTFGTSSTDRQVFAASVVSAIHSLQAASVIVDQVVFEPKHFFAMLGRHPLPPHGLNKTSITALGPQEAGALLVAALGDDVDFLFVPVPRPFLVFADHHDYATIYAQYSVESESGRPVFVDARFQRDSRL